MSKKDCFLILGMPPGGLFLSRQLRRAFPAATIYAIGDGIRDIGRYSNTINRFYDIGPERNVFEVIKKAYSEIGGGEVRAFFASNPMLETIIERYPEAFEFLDFENSIEIYQILIDKNQTIKLCDELGIRRPKEFVSSDTSDDPQLPYPFVIKPVLKEATTGISKCAYIRTEDDYVKYMQIIFRHGVDKRHLLFQQLIDGDNRWEYGYGGYFHDGKPMVDICFHQFIQVPQGLCCYCREMTNSALENDVKALVQPFLDYTHYTGLIEFDIKQDSKSKELYLLDINPRPWRSSDMIAAKLGDSSIYNPSAIKEKIIWRYPYRELYAKKNPNNVSYSVCQSLAGGYRNVTQYSLSDKSDKRPYRMQRREDIKDLFKRIVK